MLGWCPSPCFFPVPSVSFVYLVSLVFLVSLLYLPLLYLSPLFSCYSCLVFSKSNKNCESLLRNWNQSLYRIVKQLTAGNQLLSNTSRTLFAVSDKRTTFQKIDNIALKTHLIDYFAKIKSHDMFVGILL